MLMSWLLGRRESKKGKLRPREEEMAEELPEFLRRGRGYDLKALIAILALKVSRLEQELSRLRSDEHL